MQYTLNDYFKDSGVQLDIPYAQHVGMRFMPREDQKKALNQSIFHNRYLNASDPGTGKTCPSQAYACYWVSEGQKVLVVMPPALLYQYVESFKETYDGIETFLRFHILDQSPAKRRKLFADWDKGGWPEVLCLSYQLFYRLAQTLKEAGYRVVIADEAHALKNPESRLHKEFKSFLGDWEGSAVLAMTGTPIANELKDAYGMCRIVNPEAYQSFREFEIKHIRYRKIKLSKPKKLRNGGQMSSVKIIDHYTGHKEVSGHLYRYGMRVLKEDVLSLQEATIQEVSVKLSPKHLKLYKQLARERMLEIGDELITALQEQGLRMKLLQIVTCPELFIEPQEKIENNVLSTTRELLDSIGVQKTKVVIFANFQATVEKYAEFLRDLNPAVIYGKSSDKDSEKKKFIENETCRVLIANPISAGVGVDGLQKVAHHVIFLEPVSTPGVFQQAMDRLHRGGQTKPVVVYILKAMGTLSPKATKDMRRKMGEVVTTLKDASSLLDYFNL